MDEREFNALADAMLARIEQALDQCAADIDIELKPGGVIEIEFADTSKIIINRHAAAREIWIAAKSGGYHFKPDPADGRLWIAARDGAELISVLERCVRDQSGTAVDLAGARHDPA